MFMNQILIVGGTVPRMFLFCVCHSYESIDTGLLNGENVRNHGKGVHLVQDGAQLAAKRVRKSNVTVAGCKYRSKLAGL